MKAPVSWIREYADLPADHERSGDVVAGPLDRLELQPEVGQPGSEVLRRHVGRKVDVLADPGHWGLHQISVPKAVVKRTSPSKNPRRSSMPWRNISVRSMPMPNAKPV